MNSHSFSLPHIGLGTKGHMMTKMDPVPAMKGLQELRVYGWQPWFPNPVKFLIGYAGNCVSWQSLSLFVCLF